MAEIGTNNDLLAKYFMQNNIEVNSENIEKYSNDLAELAEDFKHVGEYEKSIFTPDKDTEIDKDTFLEYVKSATRENGYDEDTASLYFDLLNSNGGDTLDYDELSKIMNRKGEITDFSMWQNLAFSITPTGVTSAAENYTVVSSSNSKALAENIKDVYGEDSDEYADALAGQDVVVTKKTLKSGKVDEIAQKIANGEVNLEDYKDLLTEDSYKALEEASQKLINAQNADSPENQNDDSTTPATDDTGKLPEDNKQRTGNAEVDSAIDEVINLVTESYIDELATCPEDVISEWEEDERYSQEIIAELRAHFTTYSDTDEANIAVFLKKNPEATRSEAIAQLTADNKIGDPFRTSEDPISHVYLTDEEIEGQVAKIHGSEKNTVNDSRFSRILDKYYQGTYSGADVVAIMKQYGETYSDEDTLIQQLYSNGPNEEMTENLGNILLEEIRLGNEDALDMYCELVSVLTADERVLLRELMGPPDYPVTQMIVEKYEDEYGVDFPMLPDY